MFSHVGIEKALDVHNSFDLKPSFHCQKVAVKAMQVLGVIKRTFNSFTFKSLNMLYKAYVWLHLEFCAPVLSLYFIKDITFLENVQHQATKKLKLTVRK